MNNLGELLKAALKDVELEGSESQETMEMQKKISGYIENANAEVKDIGSDERVIFSQFISRRNAEQLFQLMNGSSTLTALNKDAFTQKLQDVCACIINEGQSPVEMIIYSSKTPNFNIYMQGSVLNTLKHACQEDPSFGEAYRHMLLTWTWPDQLRIVLKSCAELRLAEFSDILIAIGEKNDLLRDDAAMALVNMEQEQYYARIVNLYSAIKNDTGEAQDSLWKLCSELVKSDRGKEEVLKAYFDTQNNKYSNLFQRAVSKRLNDRDLRYILEQAQSSDDIKRKRALYILGKSGGSYGLKYLKELEDIPGIDKKDYVIALGYTNSPEVSGILQKIIADKNNDEETRQSAIISMGNLREGADMEFINAMLENAEKTGDAGVEISAASAAVELGDVQRIKNIFKYMISEDFTENDSRYAARQIKRLRGLNRKDINEKLDLVSAKVLEKVSGEDKVYNIVYTLASGSSQLSDTIMLSVMNSSKSKRVIAFIASYFTKSYARFESGFQDEVRDAFVKLSGNDNWDIRDMAMRALRTINRSQDAVPVAVK